MSFRRWNVQYQLNPGAEFQHHFHPGMDVKLFVDLLQMPSQGQDGHAEAAGNFFVG